MDLGCIDMGCVEKLRKDSSVERESSPKGSVTSASKIGKNSKAKDAVRSSLNTLNKIASQISKPPRRKTSPINWFPRKKVEPYLKRKIKMLQEVDGMHSTLDETLGDSNPHYSRVLREKIAIKEAADKAMEARKAAMVEASWCRILQAARIESKEAEAQLLKAEASASEAFEAAGAVGVIMNDIPDSAKSHYNIEIVSSKGGGSTTNTTHSVSATFETAFEVDKQVAAAVKAAFIKLAHCPSINKDEFKELLRKISENPDYNTDESYQSDVTSECESDAAESAVVDKDKMDSAESAVVDKDRTDAAESAVLDKDSSIYHGMNKIVDMMLGRLRCLKEEELASLATIVATSGLNAVLAETENSKLDKDNRSGARMSFSGRRGDGEGEIPSLDKFLVKRLTRLEREVLEAKNAAKKEASDDKFSAQRAVIGCEKQEVVTPSLDKFLVKRMSRLEKEVQEAKDRNKLETGDSKGKENTNMNEIKNRDNGALSRRRAFNIDANYESLDSVLSVKHVSRLEKEKLEAKDRNKLEIGDSKGKENTNMNEIKNRDNGALSRRRGFNIDANYESLDSVLSVKHISRLEKDKLEFRRDEEMRVKPKRKELLDSSEGSLDQVMVKHKSRLEREKTGPTEEKEDVATKQKDDVTRYSVTRRQAREKELKDAWGGLSLGNSIRPHVSRLQRDKAAWIEADEEERKRVVAEE